MATSTTTYLTNPTVTFLPATGGSVFDATSVTSSASISVGYDSLESTSFGDVAHYFVKGLEQCEVTLTCYASYGASSVEAALTEALGSGTSVITISPAGASESASNPEYTVTNAFLASFQPINGSYGELSMIEVTFTGGTFARDITP
jgi:uncharacterized membrane protein